MATRAQVHIPSPDELGALLAHVIAGVAGGTEAKWRKIIGLVIALPAWRNVRGNWRVEPRGTPQERKVVERAAEVVRAEHPYVSA